MYISWQDWCQFQDRCLICRLLIVIGVHRICIKTFDIALAPLVIPVKVAWWRVMSKFDQAGYFQCRPPANLNWNEIIQSCGSFRLSKSYRIMIVIQIILRGLWHSKKIQLICRCLFINVSLWGKRKKVFLGPIASRWRCDYTFGRYVKLAPKLGAVPAGLTLHSLPKKNFYNIKWVKCDMNGVTHSFEPTYYTTL